MNFKAFSDLAWKIAATSNQKFQIKKITEGHFTQSFNYAFFSQSLSNEFVVLACHKDSPVFGLFTSSTLGDFECLETNFISNLKFERILEDSLSRTSYNIPPSEFLKLKFHSKSEFDVLIKENDIQLDKLALCLELLQLERFDYRLFHGSNVAFEFFNDMI